MVDMYNIQVYSLLAGFVTAHRKLAHCKIAHQKLAHLHISPTLPSGILIRYHSTVLQ